MMLYTVSWSQPYQGWSEPEVEDLTLAREVLARIMAL